jgi:electron transfer flavoprotein beta subunit
MRIIVLIKQVPDTTDVKLDPKTGNLVRQGLDSIINPDDLHALEAAIRLKQETGGKVTVLSMGPPQAVDALTEAMGMGADHAILLCDTHFAGADTWATSFTLGRAIEKIKEFDLVICGRQAIDGDTAQIGPQVAEYLNLSQVSYVSEIQNVQPESLTVKQRFENGYKRIECKLPALLTVIGELNTPRYPHLGKMINACGEKSSIKIWNAADIGVTIDQVGLAGSLTQVIKTFVPKMKRAGEILKGSKEEVAETLIGRLTEKALI